MKSFTPRYSLGTYLYYPLFIGGSFWLIKGALANYLEGVIDLYTTLFITATGIILLCWIYIFTKNKFTNIAFYEGELIFY